MLSRKEIMERMDSSVPLQGRLVISPCIALPSDHEESVTPSIDIHLGNRFTLTRRRKITVYDPLSGKPEDQFVDKYFVPFGGEFILHPGQIVLAMTLEWVRMPNDLAAYVFSRSIWGRRGLLIATAVAIQPGSSSTITLELTNVGGIAVKLLAGAAIGQLFFHKIDPSEQSYKPHYGCGTQPQLETYSKSLFERFLFDRMCHLSNNNH